MNRITFLVLGSPDSIIGLPEGATVKCLPKVKPGPGGHSRLYRQRLRLVKGVTTEYFCFLDGDDDVLLPNFKETMLRYLDQNKPICYGGEYRHGGLVPAQKWDFNEVKFRPTVMHHAVLCNTKCAQDIEWPEGCYLIEHILYNHLAAKGFFCDTGKPCYDWRPDKSGARLWDDMLRSRDNSYAWFRNPVGSPGNHLPEDYVD